jgi:hypothetical protein
VTGQQVGGGKVLGGLILFQGLLTAISRMSHSLGLCRELHSYLLPFQKGVKTSFLLYLERQTTKSVLAPPRKVVICIKNDHDRVNFLSMCKTFFHHKLIKQLKQLYKGAIIT